MKLFQFLLLVFITSYSGLFAQGDDCSNATDLGSLPTPASCTGLGNGLGAAITTNGTSIGSTPGNPYVYIQIAAWVQQIWRRVPTMFGIRLLLQERYWKLIYQVFLPIQMSAFGLGIV